MKHAPSANAYLRTEVLTASPEKLRLMLLDGAVRYARQGRQAMAGKDFESSFSGVSQCRDILLELITTMNPEVDPELCDRVRSLYTYMYTELLQGSMDKDVGRIDKVIELLEYERETWMLLMEKLAGERGVGQPDRPRPAAGGPGDAGRATISVEG